jgi:hypothetical protein
MNPLPFFSEDVDGDSVGLDVYLLARSASHVIAPGRRVPNHVPKVPFHPDMLAEQGDQGPGHQTTGQDDGGDEGHHHFRPNPIATPKAI